MGGDPGECPGGGFGYGPAAENVTFKGAVTTTWRQGGIEKVGWGILANHGGGYSYRLCKAGEQLTEECFQKTPLRLDLKDGQEQGHDTKILNEHNAQVSRAKFFSLK